MVWVHRPKKHDVFHRIEPVVPARQDDVVPSSILVTNHARLVRVENRSLLVNSSGSVGARPVSAVVLEAVPVTFFGAFKAWASALEIRICLDADSR